MGDIFRTAYLIIAQSVKSGNTTLIGISEHRVSTMLEEEVEHFHIEISFFSECVLYAANTVFEV